MYSFYYDYYAIVIQKPVQIVTGLTPRTSVSYAWQSVPTQQSCAELFDDHFITILQVVFVSKIRQQEQMKHR
jgi:hypothetical protein